MNWIKALTTHGNTVIKLGENSAAVLRAYTMDGGKVVGHDYLTHHRDGAITVTSTHYKAEYYKSIYAYLGY